jgi:hypothetical protein
MPRKFRVARPGALLALYPTGIFVGGLLGTASFGADWSFDRLGVAAAVALLSAALYLYEQRLAAIGILAGITVGTVEVVGNAVSIPEAIAYVLWDDLVAFDRHFYLYLASAVVALITGICALWSAAVLLGRYRSDPSLRPLFRMLRVAGAVECGIMLLIAHFGLGGFQQSRIQLALLLTQFPSAWLLGWMGWCCGIEGGLVFTDVLDHHWGGLTMIGIPILLVVNSALIALGLLAIRASVILFREWEAGRDAKAPIG